MDKQNLMDQEAAVQLYNALCGEKDLTQVLADMQIQQGIPAEKAEENTKALLHVVSNREVLFNRISENRNAALEGVLKKFTKMGGKKQKEMLHRLYFGLSLYQDPELSGKVQEGTSIEWMFQSYYDRCGNDPKMTVEVLERQIRALVEDFHLSPQILRACAGMMKRGEVLAAGAALGETGRKFKCVAAMDLYLRNQDAMTMEEAVNTACTNVEIQAAIDAGSCGMLTENQVRVLMAVASLVCVFLMFWYFGDMISLVGRLGDKYLTYEALTEDVTGYAKMELENIEKLEKIEKLMRESLFGFLAAAGTSFSLEALTPRVSQWCGRLSTKQRFTKTLEESGAVQTLNTMADHMQLKEEAAAPRQDRERQQEEARRQAFEQEQEKAKHTSRMRVFG